jgi:hypothetical protein
LEDEDNLFFQLMSKFPVKPIWLELQIDPTDPQLLTILDRLLLSGMLNSEQILQIAQICLSEALPMDQVVIASTSIEIESAPEPIPIMAPVPTIWQTLQDELSVRWLLFLGVFLVVLSSGVLAATQWSRFPAWGQYGLLWLYTIGFWLTGSWAKTQQGLKLTANTLQMAALLLIPVNFWAIDSFGLWHQPWEIATAACATISLGGIAYFRTLQQRRKSWSVQWLIGAYAALSLLQLGWQIPHWAAITIYIGSIGIAIVLQKTRQIEKGALAIYGLGMLLLRGLFVVHLPLASFSLAIGILGWLFAQWSIQYQQKCLRVESIALKNPGFQLSRYQETLTGLIKLYQRLGAGLLTIGWLLGLSEWRVSPWQSVAVDGLALVWLWQRLQKNGRQRDVVWLFGVGLQTYFLSSFLWRFISSGALLAQILPTIERLFGEHYLFAGGLLVFPYLLAWVWLTGCFWRRNQQSLCRTGEGLVVGTGLIATCLTGAAPLGLLIDLLAVTAILAHLTHRHLPIRTSYLYFTHLGGLMAVFAAVNYRWDWCKTIGQSLVVEADQASGSSNILMILVVGGVVSMGLASIELWLAARSATTPTQDSWRQSAWNFGQILAILAYVCCYLVVTLAPIHFVWPLWLMILPAIFTYVATRSSQATLPWQYQAQHQANWWAICTLVGSIVLNGSDAHWRSIFLAIAVGLMCPIVWKIARQPLPVVTDLPVDLPPSTPITNRQEATIIGMTHLGFGLGLGINLFKEYIVYPQWLIVAAVVSAGLWLVSKKLNRQTGSLPAIYARATDLWASVIATTEILIGVGHYFYTDLQWLPQLLSIPINSNPSLAIGSPLWLNNPHFSLLIATSILIWAMADRQKCSPSQFSWAPGLWFGIIVIASQIVLGAGVHLLGGSTWLLAIGNVVLAFLVYGWQHRNQYRKIADQSITVLMNPALPGLLATWGLFLRLPFFNTYSGLLSIGIGIIAVLSSRSYRFQWPIYSGLLLITLGCYELVTYQVLQAPPGGNIADAMTIYGLVTALLALGYRSAVWIQARRNAESCWGLPLTNLTNVAHAHWAIAVTWKIAAALTPPVPVPNLTILHLLTSVLLGFYALIQGRDQDRGDWWVYLGLAELMGVGIYARSIFHELGIVDEGLILVTCLLGLLILLAPWSNWGWHNRPWRVVALVLPLSRLIFEWNHITLLNLAILATFYAAVARRQRQFGWAYLSLVFVNWAAMRLLLQYSFTSPIWYALSIGLSILVAVQWDPAWQRSRQNRHYGRLAGAGVIAVTALVWHQPWLPIILGLAIGVAGLIWRVRAWLYVGTITFLLTNSYQLVVLITERPITKWAIGLLAGMLIIFLAANFEKRREQITQALQHWLDRLQEWQ